MPPYGSTFCDWLALSVAMPLACCLACSCAARPCGGTDTPAPGACPWGECLELLPRARAGAAWWAITTQQPIPEKFSYMAAGRGSNYPQGTPRPAEPKAGGLPPCRCPSLWGWLVLARCCLVCGGTGGTGGTASTGAASSGSPRETRGGTGGTDTPAPGACPWGECLELLRLAI